jgi:transcriptional regulator GlxA family with amidase domain
MAASRASSRLRTLWRETAMRDVVFALLPRVVLLDVAGPADAFRNANTRVPDSYRLRFVAPQPSVSAAIGLELGRLEPLGIPTPERLPAPRAPGAWL